jgi:hypothetical protein
MAKLKEEQRAREKAARDAARLAKEIARAQAAAEKEKKRKEKAAEKRAELILKAASVAASSLGVDQATAARIITDVIHRLQAKHGLTTDDATEDVVRAAETSVYHTADELESAAESIVGIESAEAALETPPA